MGVRKQEHRPFKIKDGGLPQGPGPVMLLEETPKPTNLVRNFRGRIWSNKLPSHSRFEIPLKMSCLSSLSRMWESSSVAFFQFAQEKYFCWWFSWIFSGSWGVWPTKIPQNNGDIWMKKKNINLLSVQEPRNLLNSFGSFLRGWTVRHICSHGVRKLAGKILSWIHLFDETLLLRFAVSQKAFCSKDCLPVSLGATGIANPCGRLASKRNFLFLLEPL